MIPRADLSVRAPCDICGRQRRAKSMIACERCGLQVCAVCQAFQQNANGRSVGHEMAEHGNEMRQERVA